MVKKDLSSELKQVNLENKIMSDLISEIGLGLHNNECLYCEKHMTKDCRVVFAGESCDFKLSKKAIKNKGVME